MSYWFGSTSSYGYGYNAQIGVMPPQPAYVPGASPGINYYPTSTIGVAPYAPINQSPTTGVHPMGYSYGYDGYISHPYYSPPSAVPSYVDVTPQVYGANPVAPAIEQGSTTAYNPYAPYTGGPVAVTPNQFPNPYGAYTGPGVTVTPNQIYNYVQPYQPKGPSGGGSGGGAAGSGGGNPTPQKPQQQQPQRPVNVIINTGAPNHKSGAGYAGGNTGAFYNPAKQNGSYYGGAGSQYGQGGSAGYNAPSIVPYLLLGGLGIAAFSMMKKHHH